MSDHNSTMTHPVSDLPAPEWLQQAVLLPISGSRVVRLTGPDAKDLLQRLTTNDMRHASADMAVVTALLTPTGKIRNVFVVVTVDDGYLLISGPGEAAALGDMLRRQIFFMDDVKATDVSDDWQVLQLAGSAAGHAVESLGLEGDVWQDGRVRHGGAWRAFALERLEFPSIYLLCPAREAETAVEALTAAGVQLLDDWSAYHLQRILAQRAGYGREFNGDFNPLEIGMDWICAENKGCYPGQEVIARQITYGKVVRQMVLLKLPRGVADGAEVRVGKAKVGYVSSVEPTAPGAEGYGLAVLRSARVAGLGEVAVQSQSAFICREPGNAGDDPSTSPPAGLA